METIKKIDDETIEITTETKHLRKKQDLENEKEMFQNDETRAKEDIAKIDNLLSYFK